MEQEQGKQQTPKKSCMITIMFPVVDDTEALAIKKHIDEYTNKLPEKRYTFQINEV